MVRKISENNQSKSKNKNVRENYTDNFERVRPNHSRIQKLIDKYKLNAESLLGEILSWFPDNQLKDLADDLEHDYTDDEDLCESYADSARKKYTDDEWDTILTCYNSPTNEFANQPFDTWLKNLEQAEGGQILKDILSN